MSLFTRNNLLDVTDVYEARRNLMLGDCADLSRDAVRLNARHDNMRIHALSMNAFDSNQNVFLRRDEHGAVYVDATSNVRSWVRSRTEDVPLTVFSNDVGAVYASEVAELIYSADYLALSGRPTLRRILADHFGEDPLCATSCNMADLDANIRDTVYLELGLNPYALCNYDPRSTFDDVTVTKRMRLDALRGRPGVLANGGNDVIETATAIGALATTETEGLVRAGADVLDAAALSALRSNVIRSAEDKIAFYQSNVSAVEGYLRSNASDYVNVSSNLADVSASQVLSLLELDSFARNVWPSAATLETGELNLMFVPNEHDLFVDSLVSPLLAKYPYYTYRAFKYAFLFTDTKGNVDMQDPDTFPIAARDSVGIVKVKRDLTNATDPSATVRLSYMHERNVIHLDRMRTALDSIDIYRVLDAIYEENLSSNTRLLRRTGDLEEMADISSNDRLACRSNLQLSPIVSTLEYADLSRKPTGLSCFENDVGFVQGTNNLSEYNESADPEACRANLGLGSVCAQNASAFDLKGDALESSFASVRGSLRLSELGQGASSDGAIPFDALRFLHADTLYMRQTAANTGTCVWEGLPEASSLRPEVPGVVRMHADVRYDEEGTYTVDALRAMYAEVSMDIQICRAEVAALLADVQKALEEVQ